jgi:hypothetical protein
MKKGSVARFRLNPRKPPKADWRAFDAMSEEKRHRAAISDWDPNAPQNGTEASAIKPTQRGKTSLRRLGETNPFLLTVVGQCSCRPPPFDPCPTMALMHGVSTTTETGIFSRAVSGDPGIKGQEKLADLSPQRCLVST